MGYRATSCLDDDGDNNDELPNSILFPSLVAGSYARSRAPSQRLGPDRGQLRRRNRPSFSNGGETVTVNLQPGQVVTCIFVNEEDTGTVNPTPPSPPTPPRNPPPSDVSIVTRRRSSSSPQQHRRRHSLHSLLR